MATKGGVLSEDVIIEILSWLPVKSLLRFKSVCKLWHAIIANPKFISKHLENHYSNNDCGLFALYHVRFLELELLGLAIDETVARVSSCEVLGEVPIYGSLFVCGPCDGLYYLYNYIANARGLWNPVMNEFKALPPIITSPNLPPNVHRCYDIYGFGSDPMTKDYKVVVIQYYRDVLTDTEYFPSSIVVYSLRTNSWRYCGDLANHYYLQESTCYTCVNGVSYWAGSYTKYGNFEVLLAFDLATDGFQEIQAPDYRKPASGRLALYDTSIALFTVHYIEKFLDIWALNEGRWTKKFTMGPLPGVKNVIGDWRKNKVILESECDKLILCDLSTKEIRDLDFRRFGSCEGIYVCKESLVSFKDRNVCLHDEEAEKESETCLVQSKRLKTS